MILIRRAAETDREDIARVHEASIRGAGPRAYPADQVDSWAANITPQQYPLDHPFFVAEEDGRVIGFAQYHEGEVAAIYVQPEHHGRGAGRMLMQRVEDVARAEGAPRLFLNAALNSVSFYETCGFRVTGETQYRTRGGLVMSCALMEKSLR